MTPKLNSKSAFGTPLRRFWFPIFLAALLFTLVFIASRTQLPVAPAAPLSIVHEHEAHPNLDYIPEPMPKVPHLGFGTWQLQKSNVSEAVSHAIQTGFRHIDCASAYWNEVAVGKGIADGLAKTGLRRENIWITSKLWNYHKDRVEEAFRETLADLGVDYLDLYLMHWPVGGGLDVEGVTGPRYIEFIETWKRMILLLATGKVHHIGIANFSPEQLSALLNSTHIKPWAHQMELHPYLPQTSWLQYHSSHDIQVIGFSPLGNMNPIYGYPPNNDPPRTLENPIILDISQRRECTPAQVVIRWGLSRGVSIIPKSSHFHRIEENFGSLHCVLFYEDFKEIDTLDQQVGHRFNDPSAEWGLSLYEGLDGAGQN